mgnify:FL=1
MKVLVERDAFADVVAAAARVVDRSSLIPILKSVLLTAADRRLMIAGTDMGARLEAGVAAEISNVTAEPRICVPAATLNTIVSRLPKGAQVLLEWPETPKAMTIHAGRSRSILQSLPASDYPVQMDMPQDAVQFTMPGKDLAAGIAAVQFAVSNDAVRYYLCGIYMHVRNGAHPEYGRSNERRLVLAASNGYDAASIAFELPQGSEDIPGVILPDSAIPEIRGLPPMQTVISRSS